METTEKEFLEHKKLKGMRLGRIAGIGIYLDWSWLAVFLLILWNVSSFIVPKAAPQGGLFLFLGLGAAAAVLFLAGVLAHELGHALLARRAGIEVKRISLFFFGGVTKLERDPRSAGDEFRIAISGPAISLLIGAFFVLAGYLGRIPPLSAFFDPQAQAPGIGPLGAVLQWLGAVNILIGLINLVPAFPLDGGRVLHSILWERTQNLRVANRITLMAGQLLSASMMGLGAAMVLGFRLPLLGTGIMNGMWLAYAGWFIMTASHSNSPDDELHEKLEGIPVENLMRKNVPIASPGMPVRVFINDRIMKSDEPAFPVIYQDKLVGLVTMSEVQAVPREQWETKRIAEIMISRQHLAVVSPKTDIMEALHRMTVRHLPQYAVTNDNRLVGMLYYKDILKWMKEQSGQLRPDASRLSENLQE